MYSYGFPLGEKKGNEVQQLIKNDEFVNARKYLFFDILLHT